MMNFRTLISTGELETILGSPQLVIVDCRFDLANTTWGYGAYQAGHIPGAVYAHLDHDLSGPVTSSTGRHPLPSEAAFFETLGKWGIDAEKQVVVYDSAGGAMAGRLWWMLRYYGHPSTAVLDGGYPKWTAENRPVRTGIENYPPAVFRGQAHPEMLISLEEVEQMRQDPNQLLVDARTPQRYRGEVEPIDPVAGRIPGAVNRFHGDNLTGEGVMKPPEQLRIEFSALIGQVPADQVAVYCGSGVTSVHHILAMELAGLPGARLYAGSWSEWIRDPQRPVARG